MDTKNLVKLAKTYIDPKFFADQDRYKNNSGYRISNVNSKTYLCFTDGHFMPTFEIDSQFTMDFSALMAKNNIYTSDQAQENFDKVVTFGMTDAPIHYTSNLLDALQQNPDLIKLPTGELLNVKGIKPCLPFIENKMKYKVVRAQQVVIMNEAEDFILHVSPYPTKKDGDVCIDIKETEEKPKQSFGLFF